MGVQGLLLELAHDNPDIIGVFWRFTENDSKYDLAVSVALGSALQFMLRKIIYKLD